MKRLAVCTFTSGLIVGLTFNGPRTEAFGVYLIVLAAVGVVVYTLTEAAR